VPARRAHPARRGRTASRGRPARRLTRRAPMTTGQVILDVAVILVAARIGAALFESLGQPGVIGEIVAGITLGPTILGALPGDPSAGLFPPEALEVLKGIGQLGLALFMFQ